MPLDLLVDYGALGVFTMAEASAIIYLWRRSISSEREQADARNVMRLEHKAELATLNQLLIECVEARGHMTGRLEGLEMRVNAQEHHGGG